MTQTIRIACRSANGPEIREVPAEWISESGRLAIHTFERDGERTYTVTHVPTGMACCHGIEDERLARQFAEWFEAKAEEFDVDLSIADTRELGTQKGWRRFSRLVVKARPRISKRYTA